jgi:hypothetical protein
MMSVCFSINSLPTSRIGNSVFLGWCMRSTVYHDFTRNWDQLPCQAWPAFRFLPSNPRIIAQAPGQAA